MGKQLGKTGRKAGSAVLLAFAAVVLMLSRMETSLAETEETEASMVYREENTIRLRFRPPKGFSRSQEEGFGQFVRDYPLLPEGSPILLYNGQVRGQQENHAAVFDMKLSDRDLQQCADSIMRMYAEYYWKTEQYDKIQFHFVNGFLCSYSKWQQGYRVSVSENQVQWVKRAATDSSWESFEKYLDTVFAYASTLSMERESEKADIRNVEIGDVFLHGGSPGHVVMVVDVCERDGGEERAFLLAQGYMPAQQFHILKKPAHEKDSWYYTNEIQWPVNTPEFTFNEGSFRKVTY